MRNLETDKPRLKYQLLLARSLTWSKSLNPVMFSFRGGKMGTIMAPACLSCEDQPGSWLGPRQVPDTGEGSFPSAKPTLTPRSRCAASILLRRLCPECLSHFTRHP